MSVNSLETPSLIDSKIVLSSKACSQLRLLSLDYVLSTTLTISVIRVS